MEGSKKRKIECSKCHQTFNRVERLEKHQSSLKIKCDHCTKSFCNRDGYQQHVRDIITPVQEIPDIDQRIQPDTTYGGDSAFRAVRLGRLSEISDWTKIGRNYQIINKAIDHKFSYKDLQKWLMQTFFWKVEGNFWCRMS